MINIKFKVVKDYPTIDGMLYKDDIVMVEEITKLPFSKSKKIQVKDLTGKIWFVESKYLKQI